MHACNTLLLQLVACLEIGDDVQALRAAVGGHGRMPAAATAAATASASQGGVVATVAPVVPSPFAAAGGSCFSAKPTFAGTVAVASLSVATTARSGVSSSVGGATSSSGEARIGEDGESSLTAV